MHMGINRIQVHPLIRFYTEEPRTCPWHQAMVSRLWQGDITSPFPPSGNEGYVRNRDVLYLVGHYELCPDDIRGLNKAPQPKPCHNSMALQMLTSKRMTDKCHAKFITFPPSQRKFTDLGTHRDHR